MHDLVIRGGTLVDGTGAPPRQGDLALDQGLITAVGGEVGPGTREIDATGLLVTPGFVDVHTHYDGQVSWDALMEPSIYHGVTTVVMRNCGVGFAPCRTDEDSRTFLLNLVEAVEDIPNEALSVGIDWAWETFPEWVHSPLLIPSPSISLPAFFNEPAAAPSACQANAIFEIPFKIPF